MTAIRATQIPFNIEMNVEISHLFQSKIEEKKIQALWHILFFLSDLQYIGFEKKTGQTHRTCVFQLLYNFIVFDH